MVITIFGATGMVGRQLVKQSLAKDFTVRAFGRNVESLIDEDIRNDKLEAIKGSVFDEGDVRHAIKGVDAVLSVLGGAFDGDDKTRSLGIKNIVLQMEKTNVKRIVSVGGMGILNADDDTLLIDTPGYPEMYLPVGKEHQKAYNHLNESNLDWTFVCPPDILDEDARGNYVTNANYLPPKNKGHITAGDLAAFMLTELQQNNYIGKRVGISN